MVGLAGWEVRCLLNDEQPVTEVDGPWLNYAETTPSGLLSHIASHFLNFYEFFKGTPMG